MLKVWQLSGFGFSFLNAVFRLPRPSPVFRHHVVPFDRRSWTLTGLWKDKARQVSSNCHRPRHSARPAQYDQHATSALLDADASLLVAVAALSSPPEMQVHAEQNSLLRKPGPKHRPDRYNHTSLSCHGAFAHPEFVGQRPCVDRSNSMAASSGGVVSPGISSTQQCSQTCRLQVGAMFAVDD